MMKPLAAMLAAAGFSLLFAANCASPAQTPIAPAWSGLPAGHHPVRISVIEAGAARAAVFQPARDAGERARFGRVATALCGRATGATLEDCYPQLHTSLRERFPDAEHGVILETRMNSTFEASPLPGRRPLVVLMGSVGGHGIDLLAMGEFIASRGYVVAVTALADPPTQVPIDDATLTLLRQAQQDTIAALAASNYVDAGRVAIVGWSFGGAPGILYAMNDPNVRAVVSLDDALIYQYGAELVANAAGYEPTAYRGDLLLISAGVENNVPKSQALVLALTNARRRDLTIATFGHAHFSDQLGTLQALLMPVAERAAFQSAHAQVAGAVGAFLDESLR